MINRMNSLLTALRHNSDHAIVDDLFSSHPVTFNSIESNYIRRKLLTDSPNLVKKHHSDWIMEKGGTDLQSYLLKNNSSHLDHSQLKKIAETNTYQDVREKAKAMLKNYE